MNREIKENYFLSQPHQPFFLLGVFNAIAVILIFALSYKGVFALAIDTKLFHVYSLSFLLFTNVFTGFLFTTFPRFNQTQEIKKKYYVNVFTLSLVGTLLFLTGSLTSLILSTIGMSLLFITQLLMVIILHKVYKDAQTSDKRDSFWILNANYFGLLGNLLFTVSLYIPALLNAAINTSFYSLRLAYSESYT